MLVKNWEIDERTDRVEVSADIDGFRLWYRLPRSSPVSRTGDPFLAAAMLPAMVRGERLEIDRRLTVSPKLLANLTVLQEIHHSWNPALKIVPISARTSPSRPLGGGTMSFFSGGVDSAYTFLKHADEIDHLVFIQGFDFYAPGGESSIFSVGDLGDLSQLAHKLTRPADRLSAFIRDGLSGNTRQVLADYFGPRPQPSLLESALVEELNRIVAGPSIWEPRRFAGISLRTETRDLLATKPRDEDRERLNRLLLEDAFRLEIARARSPIYREAVDRNTAFARAFGKTLIPVATNSFPFGYRYNLSRNLAQGGVLASIALLLGFPTVYIPASYSYDKLFPLGSHPLTDPLWANEGTEIIHDGSEARRADKIRRIAEDGRALANLTVCFNDMNVNCGTCLKCLRTMISLKLLQAGPGPFPPFPSHAVIKKMSIAGAIEKGFFQENLDLALQSEDAGLREALQACLRRQERRELLRNVDRVILGGLIKRLSRAVTKGDSGIRRIDTMARND